MLAKRVRRTLPYEALSIETEVRPRYAETRDRGKTDNLNIDTVLALLSAQFIVHVHYFIVSASSNSLMTSQRSFILSPLE